MHIWVWIDVWNKILLDFRKVSLSFKDSLFIAIDLSSYHWKYINITFIFIFVWIVKRRINNIKRRDNKYQEKEESYECEIQN